MHRASLIVLACAGACDALTGLLLLADPVATLQLMNIPEVPSEPVYLQFIGAFVFAVGSSCFQPFLHAAGPERLSAIRLTLASTAWIRLCIASVTSFLICRGALHSMWWVVPATDTGLAIFQVVLLRAHRPVHA